MTLPDSREPQLTLHELTTYVEHCKRLVRDINFVLADEQLKHNGWTLVYAVDFSEIRNYVLPDTPPEPAPFRDGWAGWATEEVALTQFSILQRFFAKQTPLVLPEPYVVELGSFYESLPKYIVSKVAKGLLRAIEAVNRTLSSDTGRRVIELATTADGRILETDEINFLVDFFEKEAAGLVVFARGGERAPIDRLNDLLENEPFGDLADFVLDLVPFDIRQLDDQIVNERYDAIRKARGHHRAPAVSFSDAVAIEHIRLANKALEKKKTRILLLARSKHMASVLEKEAERDASIWYPNGPVIRHPRVFSNAYNTVETGNPRIPTLERRKASLELLIASASSRASREKAAHPDSAGVKTATHDPKALIKKIQEEWNVTNSLASALEKDTTAPHSDHADMANTATTLLEFLRNRDDLFDTAQRRVAEILAATTRKHEILAFQLQTDPAESARGDIKYRIEFRDQNISSVVDQLAAKPFITPAEAMTLFTAGLKSKSNYERLLAMAVSLGALGRWQLAEQAAGRSILEADAEGVPAHEGHFVMAFAIRKQKTTPRRLGDALADLDAAITERKDAMLLEPDPRYLKERGTIELMWNRKTADADGDIYRSVFTPTPEHIVALLEEALSLTSDKKLAGDILNNLCYLFATPPTVDDERAKHYLHLLEETLVEWTSDHHAWPSSIRDTVVFTKFQLAPFEATPVETFEEWARQLDSLLDADFSSDDLRWVREHRRLIHDAIRKKRGVPAVTKPPL